VFAWPESECEGDRRNAAEDANANPPPFHRANLAGLGRS
jgi:hypothetical protein